jgi:thioesterase domain-containing protein
MIPSHFITVETFPLNSNGKVDRKALPTPRRQVAEDKTEPETPTEAMLTSLYATLLSTTRIGATDSFFDLGGNSLTAMRLVNMISRETDVDIGVSAIFLHPTPRRLAAAIAGISRSVPLAGSGPFVALNSGKAESPLFLVHAIGGTVSAYAPLGQELADTFKVYGLESPALSDGGVVACSLADLVTDYTQRIRAVQRAGPYALAGWSMGGVIAFEIAQRLEQAGGDVSLLVLLDAPFAIPADNPSGEAELAARFVADAAHSLSLDTAGAPDPAVVTPAGQLAWLAGRLAGGSDPAKGDPRRTRRHRGTAPAAVRLVRGA